MNPETANAAFARLYLELSRQLQRPVAVPAYFLPGDEIRVADIARNIDGAVTLLRELEAKWSA